jgi:hypothetical protein
MRPAADIAACVVPLLSPPPKRCDERKVSRTIYNDQSPRWNDKFDFVMVSAGSMLLVNIWDKTSALEMAASLKLSKVTNSAIHNRHL